MSKLLLTNDIHILNMEIGLDMKYYI